MNQELSANTTLSHYRIVAKIGAGGMGEVYRAYDARLDREVAIKVLPADFIADKDRLQRFAQEAKATSALNHPHILTVYDIGEHEGAPFIVAELLDGQELRKRLDEGPIPLRKVMEYAQQIVSGLSAAHEKGIVHRDLKPENLFVTKDDRVKILDFGLAKLSEPGVATGSEDATRKFLTNPGMIMGTVGYMSPEQVRGEKTDHRSDIFSFGAILHEMITGRRAFRRETMAETMTAILKEDPRELSESNPNISPSLERIVRRCLERKPERRFQSTADLGFALESSAGSTSSSGSSRAEEMSDPEALAGKSTLFSRLSTGSKRSGWLRSAGWIVAAIAIVAALGFVYFNRSAVDAGPVSLSFVPPVNMEFQNGQQESLVVSPDGQKLVITGRSANGKSQLWVRSLDSYESRPISLTEGARNPFWSPDSQFIAFGADGKLKKVEAAGGPITVLAEARAVMGGSWNRDGMIVFAPDFGSVLYRVPEAGGEPVPVTTLDQSHQEDSHLWPTFMPDGKHFVFLSRSTRNKKNHICLGSLDSKETKRLMAASSLVGYAQPGWLVYMSDGALMTRPLDPGSLELSGKPLNVAEKVGYIGDTARGLASVSMNGVLTYQTPTARNMQLQWIDRAGAVVGPVGPLGDYRNIQLSPDDRQAAMSRTDPQTGSYDIWFLDLSRGVLSRITSDPNGDSQPVWSPDGSRIVWTSDRKSGLYDIFQMTTGEAGNDEFLFESDSDKYASAWSKDGRFILFEQYVPKTSDDIFVLPTFGDRQPYPLLNSEFNESQASLSPSGGHVAYVSDESGIGDVYLQTFTPDGKMGGNKQRISTTGGNQPRFSRNGQGLFYVTADGTMMSVALKPGGGTSGFGEPKALFKKPDMFTIGYDVTADGQRFLVGTKVGESKVSVNVVLNWTAGLKK